MAHEPRGAGHAVTSRDEHDRRWAEAIPQPVWMTDAQGHVEYFSHRWYEYSGATHEQTRGEGWLQFVHPDDRRRTLARWRHSLATGEPFSIECRIRAADGEYRWFLSQAIAQRAVDGDVVRWIGTLTDVSAHTRAEEALRESERTFRAIANSIPQLAWMADSTGWIFWYNERWYAYTGTTIGEMRGWGWTNVHHPEHVDRVVARIRHAFETGEAWEDTFPLRSRTGEYRWFLSRALPITDAGGRVVRWFGTNTDVTEQLAAAAEREQLLGAERQARERITTILESITDAFFALDPAWRFTYVNREAERMLQRPRRELLGRSIWEEFPEAVDTTFFREYHRAMAQQITTEFEEFYPPLESWFEVHAYPSAEGLSVYFHDVTERRRVADALRESEERFRALAENANAAIFVIDERNAIEFVNPAVGRIFGYTDEEVLGRSLNRLMPEDQRLLHDAGMRRYLATGRRKLRWEGVELPGLTKDGRIVPLEISFGEFIRDGKRYFTGIARDITERKRAEHQLRASEERYRLLADMIPQNVWITDAEGRHTYFSRRWYKYSGATPEESLGEGWLEFIHPEDRERTIARWRRSLDTGEPYEIEYRFRGTDGAYRWFLGKAMPLRDPAGRITEWFGTATDISERKRLDEERQRLMRGFSHDIKNPLGAADGWAHMLERGVYGELPESVRHHIGRIRRSIRHALEVIQDLHQLVRSEASEIPLKPEAVDLAELVSALTEEYRVTAETAGLSVRADASDHVPALETDISRVRQILGNLLSNAIKYTEEGGVTIRLRHVNGTSTPDGRAYARVDVTDTGPGIAADDQDQLFREFVRVNPGDKPGTGLGLAISQRLATVLGGRITLQSEPGRGSTFSLWLPVGRPHGGSESSTPPNPE